MKADYNNLPCGALVCMLTSVAADPAAFVVPGWLVTQGGLHKACGKRGTSSSQLPFAAWLAYLVTM